MEQVYNFTSTESKAFKNKKTEVNNITKDQMDDIGKQLMIADFYLDSKLQHNELNQDKIKYAN